jgi:putative membrane protein
MTQQHGTLRHTMDKATDVIGGMMGRAKAQSAGAHSAGSFVENAAIGNLYEIAAAQIAIGRSRSEGVREVAQQMIADHTTMTHQLRSALRMNEAADVPAPPGELDTRRRKLLDHLEAAPDDAFDKTYLDQQVLAHKENHDLLSGYAMNGDNPQLRSLAASAEPVVRRHLAKMERLQADHRG